MMNFKLPMWIILSTMFSTIATQTTQKYSPDELYRLRTSAQIKPPTGLKLHQDILRRRPRYIHRGSWRNHCISDEEQAGSISLLWTAGPRVRRKGSDRRVNCSVLTPLAKFTAHSCTTSHKFALYNIRSITNKGLLINDLIIDKNLDYLGLVETWQQQNDFLHLNSATPPGFVYLSKPRTSGKGGGLALIYREGLKVEILSLPEQPSFEMLAVKLHGHMPTVIGVLYRPPKPSKDFIHELSTILTTINEMSPHIILMGER